MNPARPARRRALALSGALLACLLPGGCTYSIYRAGDGRFLFIRGRLLSSKAVIAVVLNWAER